jgi:serine phosphatase RsbU (regulator of sigma subunit)/anti-sigma regulatory factor (Ser/Thr protein kinase)
MSPSAAPEPTRAQRRAMERAARRAARHGDAADGADAAAEIDVTIQDGDPLLAFLQGAPGPLDVSALPATSPAVKSMKEQGVQVVIPLITSGELVGVVALGPRRSERTYGRDDRRLLDSLARYAAPAIRLGQLMREQEAEARDRERMKQELHIAQLIQQQFLPSELPDLGGWHVAAFYRPARTVGGDFYDLVELADGRVMVVAGDVTDKGVPAALVMASTHALLRSTAGVTTSPAEVLQRVNDLLVPQIPVNMFVTCLALVIDLKTGRTRFANAGHNLPLVRRADGSVTRLHARGMPLGLMPGSAYDEVETVIETGEIVFLYSDGITEQHDAGGEMFDFARTEAIVAESTSGDDLVDQAVARLNEFGAGVEQEDDITLVALHRGRGGRVETVSFSVPSEIGNERVVMDRVAEIVGEALPQVRLDALKTAVSETAMNAIEHGNHALADLETAVTVRVTAESVVVEIADHGRGRQHKTETPDLARKLAGLQTPRGWGLFLVEQFADKVEEFTAADRHTVRLTMRLTQPEGNQS